MNRRRGLLPTRASARFEPNQVIFMTPRGRIADHYGRRPALTLCILCFSVLEFGSGLAPNLASFLVLRGLFGIAMGGEWGIGVASNTAARIGPRITVSPGLLDNWPSLISMHSPAILAPIPPKGIYIERVEIEARFSIPGTCLKSTFGAELANTWRAGAHGVRTLTQW
jgi:hypothetical protein